MSFFPGATGQQTAAVLNTTGGSPYDSNPSAASGLPDPGRIGSFFPCSDFQSCLYIPCFPAPIRPPMLAYLQFSVKCVRYLFFTENLTL